MKRFITVLALILAVAAVMPVFAQDRVDSKIRFSDLYGEVSIRPDAEEDDAYETAEFNTIIYDNDRIKTEEESGAILSLEDMSTYVIKPESILVIRAEDKNVSKLEMLAGCIVGNVKKMAEGKVMGVEMSQCVAGIKGTGFRLSQSKDGNINQVDVYNGHVQITSKLNGDVYDVQIGESLTIIKKSDKGQEVATRTISIEEVKKDFIEGIQKMDDKSNDEDLLKKLNDKSSGMKDTLKSFNDRFSNCYAKRNITDIDTLSEEFEALKLDVQRYRGELDEANAIINVATNRKVANNNLANAIAKASLGLKDQCANYEKLMKNILSLGLEIEQIKSASSAAQTATKEEVEVALNTITSLNTSIDSISEEAKDIIEDTRDESSYAAFKEAKEKCEQYLEDLKNLEAEMKEVKSSKDTAKALNSLSSKYNSKYQYIQKAMRNFASVPEITNDVMKNMSDIDQVIPDYSTKVKEYLSEYNAIEKSSSTDVKKRYVSAVSKLIVGYDKTKRQYTKANRMYQQVVKDFKNSAFKTSEYNEVADSWERIESSMTELDAESEELSSCVEAIKSQLEELLGQ